jgi:hypothetical protein
MAKSLVYVGLDVHKETIVIARSIGRQRAEVARKIPNDWWKLLKVLDGLGPQERLRVCYEAGPTGYDLARRLNGTGICCIVVAPSLIPVQAGRRVKTDRRDARRLAELLRAGELVEVKIPETETEAMRDLERARDDAKNAERAARHQLDKFLLRQGRIWSGRTKWTNRHWNWIERQEFPVEAQRRVLADYIRAVSDLGGGDWRLCPLPHAAGVDGLFGDGAQRRLHRPTAASGENHPHRQRTCATDPGRGGLELPFPSPRVQSDPPTSRASLGGGAGDFREG